MSVFKLLACCMDIYVTSEQLVQGISNFVWGQNLSGFRILLYYSWKSH
jgi:hypothetical protein